jgi:hypothetical protein
MTSEEKARFLKVKEKYELISQFLNQIEEELLVNKEDRNPDINKIAVAYGKITTNFVDIADLLGLYTRNTN